MALRKSATSSTERAIGPLVESGDQDPSSSGTRPGDGRKPTTLFHAPGLRSEPPVSLPSAIGSRLQLRAQAAPPLEPPTVFWRLNPLRVAPNTALKVFEPAPNSGVLVLPIVIAPAARMRCTIRASVVGTLSLYSSEPLVVRMPAVSMRSLCAIGKPCNGPSGSPRAWRSSAALAHARACSGTSVTMAFTVGFTRSMRARCASSTSRADTLLRRMRAASSVAESDVSSSAGVLWGADMAGVFAEST